jgi:hypothetical protein
MEEANVLKSVRKNEIDTFEYRLVSKFLLSTDFFSKGADENQPVKYIAYNNPYRVGCLNPMARFVD